MMKRLSVLCILLVGFLINGVSAVQISSVRVENLSQGPLDDTLVFTRVGVAAGDDLPPTRIRSQVKSDVESLQKSGLFSEVQVRLEDGLAGTEVIYAVRPRPRIQRLSVQGAEHLGNKKVRHLMTLNVGDLVDDGLMGVQAKLIRDEYLKKRYPDAQVTWDILENNTQGLADVEVTVTEGQRAKIEEIRFSGAHSMDEKLLRKSMKQKESGWFSWLTRSGVYEPDQLAIDRMNLRTLYLNEGYLDVQIDDPKVVDMGKGHLSINMPVSEGHMYTVKRIAIEGCTIYSEEELMRVVGLQVGQPASIMNIDNGAQSIRRYYGNRGYIRTRVIPNLDPDLTAHTVDVLYTVGEGVQASIGDIRIRGNSITKDKVIRRELIVYPGQEFNQQRVERSESRLKNLGYFDMVNSHEVPTDDPAIYDLEFKVHEQKTGQFMVGAGFSSIEQVLGFAEISQGNFDLFNWPPVGGGQKLKLRTTFGSQSEDVEFSYVEPWFLNRRLSLGFDLYMNERRFLSDDYNQKTKGGRITLQRPLPWNNRLSLAYLLEEIDVFDVADSASDLIKVEEGARTKSAITLSLTHDTRNNPFVPSRGNRSVLSATYAGGPLGAETDLYNLTAQTSVYHPLWFGHYLNLRGRTSVVEEFGDSENVPIFDRLFLGGARTVRGFEYRDVGPKDENEEPIGGRTLLYGTAEYNVPIAEKFRMTAFYDTGMIWEDAYDYQGALNSSVGVGLRIDIPGFPLRFDYAWPQKTDEFNDNSSARFSFLIGYFN